MRTGSSPAPDACEDRGRPRLTRCCPPWARTRSTMWTAPPEAAAEAPRAQVQQTGPLHGASLKKLVEDGDGSPWTSRAESSLRRRASGRCRQLQTTTPRAALESRAPTPMLLQHKRRGATRAPLLQLVNSCAEHRERPPFGSAWARERVGRLGRCRRTRRRRAI